MTSRTGRLTPFLSVKLLRCQAVGSLRSLSPPRYLSVEELIVAQAIRGRRERGRGAGYFAGCGIVRAI
jgi:hypothetical protein